MMFEGFAKTNSGELKVIVVSESTTLPAGTTMHNGLARSPNGYLYIVVSA
jgi:hypothetical protein